MNFWIQIVGSYVATVTSGILLKAPRYLLWQTGFIGAIGYAVYLLVLNHMNTNIATFLSGIVIAFLSQVFSRFLHSPVTIFYIPSFFPLVPGAAVYKVAYYYISNDPKLAGENLLQSISISGAIALSIFIVESFLEVYLHLKTKYKKI